MSAQEEIQQSGEVQQSGEAAEEVRSTWQQVAVAAFEKSFVLGIKLFASV